MRQEECQGASCRQPGLHQLPRGELSCRGVVEYGGDGVVVWVRSGVDGVGSGGGGGATVLVLVVLMLAVVVILVL